MRQRSNNSLYTVHSHTTHSANVWFQRSTSPFVWKLSSLKTVNMYIKSNVPAQFADTYSQGSYSLRLSQSRQEWLHLDGKFLWRKLCRAFLDFHFRSDLELQSWTKVWGQICNCGAFFNLHMPNPFPLPTPQTTVDTCIQNFSRFSTLYRVGGRRTASNFRKRMHCFKRVTRNLRKINTALLSWTFVEDCS